MTVHRLLVFKASLAVTVLEQEKHPA